MSALTRPLFWALFITLSVLAGYSTLLTAATQLKWASIVSTAASNNREIRQANAQIEIAIEGIRLAQREYGPKVNASVGSSQSLDGSGGLNLTQGVTLTQSKTGLFDGEIDVSAAILSKSKAVADAQLTLLTIRKDLATAYINVWYATQLVRLNGQIVTRRNRNYELIHAGFESGREHLGSAQWANAQAQRARVDLVQSKRQVELALLDLAAVIGLRSISGDPPTQLEPELVSPPPLSGIQPPAHHPSLIAAQVDIDSETVKIGQSKSTALPSFYAGINATQANPLFRDGSGSSGLSASVGLSIPLFTNNIEDSRIKQAKLGLDRAVSKKEAIELTLNRSIQSAEMAIQSAQDDWNTQRQFRNAAITRSEIAEAQYRSGLLNYENWDVIENEVINQERQLLARERDLYLTIANWHFATGKGF